MLAIALPRIFSLFNFFKRDKAKPEHPISEQAKLGHELNEMSIEAAKDNKVYNLFIDGRICESIGKILVREIPKNGGRYSILIDITEGRSRLIPIAQVDINLEKKGKELSILYGPYGPLHEFDISEIKFFTNNLKAYIMGYRLFR